MQVDLEHSIYLFGIALLAFNFDYIASVPILIKVFSLVIAATTCVPWIVLKIYKSNLFLFATN